MSNDKRSEARQGTVTGKAFWLLIDRWGIPDALALQLIDQPGGLTRTGKRPRFALTAEQVQRFSFLQELDGLLQQYQGGAGVWLQKRDAARPFANSTPLELMIRRGLPGFADTLRYLNRQALRKSL
jgi:hypothetical protein